jgi:hypothetical protein
MQRARHLFFILTKMKCVESFSKHPQYEMLMKIRSAILDLRQTDRRGKPIYAVLLQHNRIASAGN